jgi:hypothetical protein
MILADRIAARDYGSTLLLMLPNRRLRYVLGKLLGRQIPDSPVPNFPFS